MKRILITNLEECKKVQLELFNLGYKWFNDEYNLIPEEKFRLISKFVEYPLVINLHSDKTLTWNSKDELNSKLKKQEN